MAKKNPQLVRVIWNNKVALVDQNTDTVLFVGTRSSINVPPHTPIAQLGPDDFFGHPRNFGSIPAVLRESPELIQPPRAS